ncbi:MAG: TonB-dependent receptor [Luteimonas sp.]|nr:TonB-dependent receptor [Luteimonas sp.]
MACRPTTCSPAPSPSTPDGRFGFGPSGNLLPEGGIGQTTWDDGIGGYRHFNPRQDGYNFAPDNYLRTPYQRTSLFAQARTDIASSASLRGELLLQRRRSSQELAPTPIFQFGASGAPNHAAIHTDNLYNTFSQPVTSFTFRPLNRPRRFEQDATTHHLSIGVEGLSEVASRTFDWRLNLVDARRRKDDAILGGYDLQRLALGVGPSYRDEGGTPRCGSPAAPLAGCVPLDFLHGSSGFTDMMYDHIAVAAGIHEDRRLQMASLSAGSELLSLPGGPATLAAGLEWRRERGRIDMDALLSEDSVDFGGFAPEPIDGGILVREAWAELELPLLSPRPWAQSLSLNLAGRYSDYSSFGNTGNGKASLAWRPRPGLLLRGAWSQGYRAPSINELFAVGGVLLPEAMAIPLLDPCATPADAVVAARCRAAGVPVGFDPQQPPRIRIGSNPWLQPERARNRSLGIVWSPPKVAGLDMALDWWRIELRDTIDDIPAQELSRQCYVEAIDAACGQLQRDPATGVLVEIDARLHNNGVYEIEGFDVSLGYRRSGRFGDVEVRWDSVYLARHQRTLPAGGSSTSLVGNYATRDPGWRLRSLLSLDWRRHRFGTTVRLRHYSALDESCHVPANAGRIDLCDRPDLRSPTFGGAPEHIIRARTYVDLQLHWEPWQGASFSVGVDNASGRQPPVSFNAPNSYDPAYDIPGRFWHAGWRVRF